MTDKEKRAHDLATQLLPHIMEQCEWEYYEYDVDDKGHVSPDVIDTYNELYKTFLEKII